MIPDMVGPTAGASPMAIPTIPIALPRCSGGKTDSMIVWLRGMVTPTARAWMIRATIKIWKLGATKAITVPSRKVAMAPRYMVRELNLLINQAETGIMIPLVSIKAVVSHCTVEVETSKDFIIAG